MIQHLNLKLTDEQCEQLECELETIARESKNGNPIDQFTFEDCFLLRFPLDNLL
jgi:hypothetical protein